MGGSTGIQRAFDNLRTKYRDTKGEQKNTQGINKLGAK